MKAEELKQLIHFNEEHQRYVAIPNSLFTKLSSLTKLTKTKPLKTQHIGYAFSYIYLQTYMFRYAKYDKVIPTASQIKAMLGYSSKNKTVDYITKRKGILDEAKITHTSHDFVLIADYEDDFARLRNEITFTYVSDLYEYELFRNARNISLSQSYKVPIFGFYSNPENYFNEENELFDGVFYPYYEGLSESYTLIDFNVFAHMMENEELGVNAFYLYCYLLYKNELFQAGYEATSQRLSDEIGMSKKTIERYRDAMRSFNVMQLIHNMDYFVVGLKDSKSNFIKKEAASNLVNEFEDFTYEKVTYNKPNLIGLNTYKKMKYEEAKKNNESTYLNGIPVEIEESELPF